MILVALVFALSGPPDPLVISHALARIDTACPTGRQIQMVRAKELYDTSMMRTALIAQDNKELNSLMADCAQKAPDPEVRETAQVFIDNDLDRSQSVCDNLYPKESAAGTWATYYRCLVDATRGRVQAMRRHAVSSTFGRVAELGRALERVDKEYQAVLFHPLLEYASQADGKPQGSTIEI
jgi:hypothetical protein